MPPSVRPRLSRKFNEVVIETPYSASFVSALKAVIPKTFRRYDSGIWYVNPTYYSCVLTLLKAYFGSTYIDSVGGVSEPQVSGWKEAWDVFVATDGKRAEQEQSYNHSATQKSVSKTVYQTLYVTEDAPKQVIVAAYRALAQLHHPDNGGDTEVMSRINAAYQELKRKERV